MPRLLCPNMQHVIRIVYVLTFIIPENPWDFPRYYYEYFMIIHDHKIFEGVPNTTENDTCVIFGTIKVKCLYILFYNIVYTFANQNQTILVTTRKSI